MDFFEKIKLVLFYDGLTKEEYDIVYNDIYNRNLKNLFAYNLIIASLSLILFLVSCIWNIIESNRISYFTVFLFCSLLIILIKKVAPNKLWIGKLISYIFSSGILLWAIYIGTVTAHNQSATSFSVCLAILPFVAYNTILLGFIHRIIAIIAFVIIAQFYKTPSTISVDLVNIIAFGLVGTGVSIVNQLIQANAMLTRKNVYSEIRNLSNIFNIIRIIDLKNNTSVDYEAKSDTSKGFISRDSDARTQMENLLKEIVSERNSKRMVNFCNFATLEDRLYDKQKVVCDFIDNNNEWQRAVFLVVQRNKNGFPSKVSFTLEMIADKYYIKTLDMNTESIE